MIKNIIDYEIGSANLHELLKANSSILDDLWVSLNCEEKLTAVPMITDEIIFVLIKMYKLGIYTEKSAKCIDYIRAASSENTEIDKVLLVAESKEGCFDLTFNHRLVRLYNSEESLFFDKIINRMINHKDFIFEPKLTNIIYGFYKRNNDINSLRILLENIVDNKINPKETCISIEDIISLKNVYKELEEFKDPRKVLKFFSYYKNNKEIDETIINILKKIIFGANNRIEKLLDIKDYIEDYKDRSPEIKDTYILLVAQEGINTREQLEEMIEALRDIIRQENLLKKKAIAIIKAIIIYYCKMDDYDNIVKYVDFYVYQLAILDNYKVLTELIKNQRTKYIGEAILLSIDKIHVRALESIINEACDRVIATKRYSSIIDALKHLDEKKIPGAGYVLAVKYLGVCEHIEAEEYQLIAETLRLLPRDKQVNLYEELIKRQELPIEIRLEFFRLSKNIENLQILYEAFVDKEIYSRELKDAAAKHYYGNNQEFLKLVASGDCSLEVLQLVNRKVRETLAFDFKYITRLVSSVKNKDSILEAYKDIIDSGSNDISKENYIIGEHKKNPGLSNEFCESGELINILNQNEKLSYIAFNAQDEKAYRIKIILANYMNNNGFEYIDDIKENILAYKEIHHKRQYISHNITLVLENLLKLIRLQKALVEQGITIDAFTLDGLMYSREIIIPRFFSYLEDELDEYINEDKSIEAIITYINTIAEAKVEENAAKEELYTISKLKSLLSNGEEINCLEHLIIKLSAFTEPMKVNPQKLSFKAQIENFNSIATVVNKEAVIERIVNSKTTILEAKRLIINWDGRIRNKGAFLDYLLLCFITARAGLDEDELLCIYDKIIELIRRNSALLNKDKKRLFCTKARTIPSISKEKLEKDLYGFS